MKRNRLQLVFNFLYGSKRWFILAVLFAVSMQFISLVNPKLIGFTVDSVIGNLPSSLPSFANGWIDAIGGVSILKEHLYYVALMIIAVAVVYAFVHFCFRVCNAIGSEILVKNMRDQLYTHLSRLPFSWYGENQTGDIIQRCTSDVETIKVFLSEQLTSLLRIVVLIVLAVSFMMQIHFRLAVISACFIPVIISYSVFFHTKIGKAFQHADEEEGKLSAIAQENLTGVRVVRAFGRESYERERFETQNASYTSMWVHLMKLLSMFWSTGDFFSGLQILTVTSLGAYFAVKGEMTAGSYISFIGYNAMLTWPVRQIGRVIAQLSKAMIAIDRIAYIMHSPVEETSQKETPDMHGDIVFDHVSFAYEENIPVLHDISMRIPAGSTVGILGSTGCGKSTLMYLLDGVYPMQEGAITISGTAVQDISLPYLRQNIGMVLQEPYLFSKTLYDNIKIAQDSASKEDVETVSHIASLDHAISHFKQGYETFVGERGVTLSGGQKQRTAIAQMLIRKPPIMIFDDSLSAVDAETDARIRASLKEYTENTTTILIAHRISTLMHADIIYVLDEGRIVESGTHAQLLQKQDGVYKHIYALQTQMDEE